MARSLEEVNLIRKQNGQEPLTELPINGVPPAPEKTKEEIESEQQAIEAKKKEDAEKVKPKEDKPVLTTDVTSELDDASLLALLEKRGIKVSSIEELTPKEDAAVIAEKRESAKISYGLNKGTITKKQYENFVVDSRDPKNLVFGQYHADAKAEDPNLTDDQIQEDFVMEFGLDAEAGTRKHKYGQQKLSLLANKMLQEKYPAILSLDNDFTSYETEQRNLSQIQAKVKAGMPVYNKDVDDVFVELEKINTKFSDDEEYVVPALKESLESIKSQFLDSKYAAGKIVNGYKKEDLKEIAFTTFLRQNFPYLAKEIANQKLLKQQAGTRGIPVPTGNIARKEDDIDISNIPHAAKQYRSITQKAVKN
jgi:hypothetical protein